MFLQVLSKVVVLFIVLFIGGLARHKNVLAKESTNALAHVVLVVTLPFLYFYSLATGVRLESLRTIWVLPVFAVCLVLIAYAIAKVFLRFVSLSKSEKATFVYVATFTNCGFLAIPIANALYGPEGVVGIVFFNVGFNLLYWTLGVWTLERGSKDMPASGSGVLASMKNLVNSGTIGLLAGLTAGLAALKIPHLILDSTGMLGSATIPMALLVVGSIMSKAEIKRLRAYRKPPCHPLPQLLYSRQDSAATLSWPLQECSPRLL